MAWLQRHWSLEKKTQTSEKAIISSWRDSHDLKMCKHELSRGQIEKSIEATSQYTTKYQSQFTSWPSLNGKHIKTRMMPFTRVFKQVLHFQLYRNRAMPRANFPTAALKYCLSLQTLILAGSEDEDPLPGKKALLPCWPEQTCTTLWHLCHPNNIQTDIQTTVRAICYCPQPPRCTA